MATNGYQSGMAIPPTTPQLSAKQSGVPRLNATAQKNVLSYISGVMTVHQKQQEMFDKMEVIDQAYARYQATGDTAAGAEGCDVFNKDQITPPIVVSQVDAAVAYLAEVFCSGTPLFPVVSNPAKRVYAEQLETLLDDHARIGGYARQILLFLRDGCKYNYSALECCWESINQFTINSDFTATNGRSLNKGSKFFNKLKRHDPYNVIRDPDVAPGDIAAEGDYAGFIETLSYIKLKRRLQQYQKDNVVYNFGEALKCDNAGSSSGAVDGQTYYRQPPTISDYVSPKRSSSNQVDWEAYMTGGDRKDRKGSSAGKSFEVITLYARIIPSEFGISVPSAGTPQIWKFVVVNSQYMVYAERIISAYDYLPMFFGQPLEDGLDYQTQSVAEGEIEFQEGASKLFNIRFAAARRAVSDRALYRAEFIRPTDVNSKVSAAKIPVNIPALSTMSLGDAYHQIPFDMRGTETTISDAQQIVAFSQQLHGLNNPRQGQFQKGNKSVQEWNDTMGASDGRTRLLALTLEYQVFSPMKDVMTLNIYQYGDNTQVVSQRTGETLDINMDELRKQVLAFRIADGYTPKSKMASTDAITVGLQTIQQSPILQQAYGPMLPFMFAHMMQLMGVRGLDEYSPQIQAQAVAARNPGNLAANSLQGPPTAGQIPGGSPMLQNPAEAGTPSQFPNQQDPNLQVQ